MAAQSIVSTSPPLWMEHLPGLKTLPRSQDECDLIIEVRLPICPDCAFVPVDEIWKEGLRPLSDFNGQIPIAKTHDAPRCNVDPAASQLATISTAVCFGIHP